MHDFDALDEPVYVRLMAAARRLSPAGPAATRPVRVGLVIAGFGVPHGYAHLDLAARLP